jgi:ribonuclease J
VDGKGVGDVEEMVLRDRRRLSGHGMVIVILALNEDTGETIYGPEIISRGFVLEDETGSILEDAKCIVLEVLDELDRSSPIEWTGVELDIKRRLKHFFQSVIERRPLIIPTIIPV